MLSIALLLFAWRGLVKKEHWEDGMLKLSFLGLNGGLLIMSLLTLFPVGIVQAWISFRDGLWAARDAAFFERPLILFLGNLRVVPDLIIICLGVLPLVYFLFKTYPQLKAVNIKDGESVWDKLGIKL
jgi:nitric oxide reductase subunit B